MVDVELQWAVPEEAIPTQQQCEEWMQASLIGETAGEANEVTVRIVDADEIQALNRDYRQIDKATNVLSFEFENPPGLEDLGEALPYLGDLVICAEVIKQEAEQQNKTLEAHWAHMIVHGTLHLQGYDHIDENDADEMESLEVEILAGLGFADPYQVA